KSILLKPGQEKSIFWTIKIPGDVKSNYLYSTVFEVVNSFGNVESEKINFASNYATFTTEQANAKIKEYEEIEELSFSENLDIDCKPEKKYYYDYEKASLLCTVKNIGNQIIKEVNVCIDLQCQKIGLHISESKNMKFDNLDSNKQLEIKATNGNIDLNKYFTIKSLSDPKLRVTNLVYPDLVSYKGIGDLQFTLNSEAPVKNIRFLLNGNEFYKQDGFSGIEERIFTIKGKYFYSTENSHLIIEYEDENGYKYMTEKSFFANVQDLPFYVKFFAYVKNSFR
ncbi:hypothetical protein J4427_01665, partial [Candidatus Woesearchaeota archaeon]|nr:hypothetical protein [Candidatus Woesearchaeota archaeon]